MTKMRQIVLRSQVLAHGFPQSYPPHWWITE